MDLYSNELKCVCVLEVLALCVYVCVSSVSPMCVSVCVHVLKAMVVLSGSVFK